MRDIRKPECIRLKKSIEWCSIFGEELRREYRSGRGYSPDRFDQGIGLCQDLGLAVAIELHVVKPAIVTGLLEQFRVRAYFT